MCAHGAQAADPALSSSTRLQHSDNFCKWSSSASEAKAHVPLKLIKDPQMTVPSLYKMSSNLILLYITRGLVTSCVQTHREVTQHDSRGH